MLGKPKANTKLIYIRIKIWLLCILTFSVFTTKHAFAMPDIFLLSPLITAGDVDNLNGGTVPILVGQTFEISWILENAATTSGTSQITHHISINNNILSSSDVLLGSTTVSNASAFTGINQNLVMSSVPSGTYRMGSCYPTSSGTRCSTAGTVSITAGPDILLLSPLLTSRGKDNLNGGIVPVRVGDSLKISWVLENYGGASNNVQIDHYFSKDRNITSNDSLFGSQTISVEQGSPVFAAGLNFTKNATQQLGRYYVGTCTSSSGCSIAGEIEFFPVPPIDTSASLPAVVGLLLDD